MIAARVADGSRRSGAGASLRTFGTVDEFTVGGYPAGSRAPWRPSSRPGFQDEVEGCLGGAAEPREATLEDDFPESSLPGLRAKRQTDLLGQRGRGAQQCRRRVIDPADRVQVVLDAVVRERLDDEPRAVGGKGC